jgi:hypothetical protein
VLPKLTLGLFIQSFENLLGNNKPATVRDLAEEGIPAETG